MITLELAPDEVEWLVRKLHGIDDAGERTGTRDNVFIIAVGIWAVVMVVLVTSALVLLVQIMRERRIILECGSMA